MAKMANSNRLQYLEGLTVIFVQAHFITARTKSWEYLEGLKGVWRVLIQCVCYAKITARCLKIGLHLLLDCIFELIHSGGCAKVDCGNHGGSVWGTLPQSWSLIRWAHTQHVPLVSSAWLALPPEIKDGWSVLMEERRVKQGGGYKKVGGNGWRVRVWLWREMGGEGDILRPLCACVGDSHHPPPLPPSDTDLFVGFILKTLALWRWPPRLIRWPPAH